MANRVYRADRVLPINAPAIHQGMVVVSGARIAWLGAESELPAEYASLDSGFVGCHHTGSG